MKLGRSLVTNDQVRHLVVIQAAILVIGQSPYSNLDESLIKVIHI